MATKYCFILLFAILGVGSAKQDAVSAVVNKIKDNVTPGKIPVPNLPGLYIVGGGPINITEANYQVSLQYVDEDGEHGCGGSVIANNVILTAAHCVSGLAAADIQIRAGSTYNNTGGVVLNVTRISVHPNYTAATNGDDVALLWLAENLEYGDTIGQITMAATGAALEAGTEVLVTGWGYITEGGPTAQDSLQAVNVPIVSNEVCNENYGGNADNAVIKDTMLCAGMPEGGRDSCQYDSGGPLVSGGVQYGIVSWGYGCARPNRPGVYASVAALRAWIDGSLTRYRALDMLTAAKNGIKQDRDHMYPEPVNAVSNWDDD